MPEESRVHFLADALDPEQGKWTVYETDAINACVSLKTKEAYIPHAYTRAQEQIRLHEAAHVHYSRHHEHESEQAQFICNMLEEIRVDTLLRQSGIDVRNRHDDVDMSQINPTPNPYGRGMMYLQLRLQITGRTTAKSVKDKWMEMYKALPEPTRNLLEDAARAVIANPSVEEREEWVRKLFRHFAPPPPKPPLPDRMPIKNDVAGYIKQKRQEQAAKERELQEAQEAKEAGKKEQKKPGTSGTSHPEFEPDPEEEKRLTGVGGLPSNDGIEIHDHLARNQKFLQVKAPFTRTGRGLVPEFMEQWCVDKRVYRTDHRGGVVVLDTSGSMSPNFPLIQQQMHEFPNLVVLSYRGVYGKSGIDGRICIHARNGRIDPIFRKEPNTTGSNNADEMALKLASKFKGPRIWVSDGYACGGRQEGPDGYGFESGLATRIRAIMHRNHIIRVLNLEDALKWVNMSGSVHYWTAGVLDDAAYKAHEDAIRAQGQWPDKGDTSSDWYGSTYHRYGRRRN